MKNEEVKNLVESTIKEIEVIRSCLDSKGLDKKSITMITLKTLLTCCKEYRRILHNIDPQLALETGLTKNIENYCETNRAVLSRVRRILLRSSESQGKVVRRRGQTSKERVAQAATDDQAPVTKKGV